MILQGELKKWYWTDVGLPLLLAVIINATAYFLLTGETSIASSPIQTAVFIAIVFLITLAGSMISIPTIRHFFLRRVLRYE
jgi:hypothetical protein